MKKKIYVGCALLGAPPEFVQEIKDFKKALAEKYEVLEFVDPSEGTPADVFTNDTRQVKECDLLLAICNYPSTGLGYEVGMAMQLNKPVLAVAHKTAKVSRMILGANGPNFTFRRYNNLSDVLNYLN